MKREKTTITLDSMGEVFSDGAYLRNARCTALPPGMGKSHLIAETARRYGHVISVPHAGPAVLYVHQSQSHMIAEAARRYGQVVFVPDDGPAVFFVYNTKAKA
jgi:hypothetical protein